MKTEKSKNFKEFKKRLDIVMSDFSATMESICDMEDKELYEEWVSVCGFIGLKMALASNVPPEDLGGFLHALSEAAIFKGAILNEISNRELFPDMQRYVQDQYIEKESMCAARH